MFLIVGLTWKIWLRHVAEFVLLVMLQYWHNKQPFSLRKYLFKTYTVCTTNQLNLCLYAPECVFITQILPKLLFYHSFYLSMFFIVLGNENSDSACERLNDAYKEFWKDRVDDYIQMLLRERMTNFPVIYAVWSVIDVLTDIDAVIKLGLATIKSLECSLSR